MFLVLGVTGFLGANGIGLLMAGYPRDAGAAAALFGAAQFGFGASMRDSLLHDGTALPMAGVILTGRSMSLLGQVMYARRAGI